jgi:hypothetical protein
MPGQRRGGMVAWLAGTLLAAVAAAVLWAVPSQAGEATTDPCSPVVISPNQSPPPCIQPWIWPDGGQNP